MRSAAGLRRKSGGGAAKTSPGRKAGLWGVFPKGVRAASRYGVGVFMAIAERRGGDDSLRHVLLERFASKPAQRPRTRLLEAADAKVIASILTGLAHPDRIRVARAILAGACTHHDLVQALKLKTGPLYHHLRELERAGLLVVAGRNRYDLTELGRICALVSAALGTWQKGGRSPWRVTHHGPP